MTPVIHAVTLPNQVTLPYVEQGDPAGIPVSAPCAAEM